MAKKQWVILDTHILIEIMRRNISVIQKCDQLGIENLAISSISYSEFHSPQGIHPQKKESSPQLSLAEDTVV